MMRYNYDLDDSDFATAIAASAYAIHALEEANLNKIQIRKANTRKQEPFRPPQAEDQRQKQASIGLRSLDGKADAWEKAQIAKIRKWHEKMQSKIAAWEKDKKLRERNQMERKKSELEQRKSRNLNHYHNKIARIDRIAGGARTQVEEKRKKDESIVKKKARKMRSTGQVPVNCFCF